VADEFLTPRAAMRAAAEALAEVEPATPPHLESALPKPGRAAHPNAASPASERRDALQAAMRDAVDAEVARELGSLEHQGQRRGPGPGKVDGSTDGGKDDRDQAHGDALQAQGAKVVGVLHSQGMAKGHGKTDGVVGVGSGSSNGGARGLTAAAGPRLK
jgi:hypothetical protein